MEKFNQLIEKFWQGIASEKDKFELIHLLNDTNEELRNEFETQYYSTEENKALINSEEILFELHSKQNERMAMKDSSQFKRRKYVWAVAITIFAVAITSLITYFNTPKNINNLVKNKIDRRNIFFTNTESQVKDTLLSDGSSIRLYPKSSIEFYNNEIAKNNTTIKLKGKARFHIVHNKNRIFKVIANNILTTDLGTIFIIDALKLKALNIALLKGLIQVESIDSSFEFTPTILKPNEEINFDLTTKKIAIHSLDKMNTKSHINTSSIKFNKKENYIHRTLSFNKISIIKVFKYLETQFQVTIHLKGIELDKISFTGTFKSNEDLSSCLDIICSLSDLKYNIHGSQIEIYN